METNSYAYLFVSRAAAGPIFGWVFLVLILTRMTNNIHKSEAQEIDDTIDKYRVAANIP